MTRCHISSHFILTKPALVGNREEPNLTYYLLPCNEPNLIGSANRKTSGYRTRTDGKTLRTEPQPTHRGGFGNSRHLLWNPFGYLLSAPYSGNDPTTPTRCTISVIFITHASNQLLDRRVPTPSSIVRYLTQEMGKVGRKKQHLFEDGTSFEGGWENGVFHGHGSLKWGKLCHSEHPHSCFQVMVFCV